MAYSLRRLLVVATVLVLVALFFRVVHLSKEDLEGDELFSLGVATSSPSQAWQLIRHDMLHPPLYYFLLKATLPNGRPPSELRIRVLSLVAGTASIGVLVLIGYFAEPLRAPSVLAAFLLALNAFHILYSQQARSYALFCFLVGVLLLWSVLMDRFGRDRSYWVAGTVLMAILFYIHYFAIFYCFAVVLPIAFLSGRELRIRAIACMALAFASFLPWIYQVISVYRDRSDLSASGGSQAPPLADLKATFAEYMGIPNFRGATTLVLFLGFSLIIMAMLPNLREARPLDARVKWTLAWAAWMPPLLAFVLSRPPFLLPTYNERYLLPSILPVLLLVSFGLWRVAALVSEPQRRLVLAAGIAGLVALQALPLWAEWPGPVRQSYAELVDWLRQDKSGLPVYAPDSNVGAPAQFYLKRDRRIEQLPPDPADLPDRCIVLYRAGDLVHNAPTRSLFGQFDIVAERSYAQRNSRWGVRLAVVQRHNATAQPQPGSKAAIPESAGQQTGRRSPVDSTSGLPTQDYPFGILSAGR